MMMLILLDKDLLLAPSIFLTCFGGSLSKSVTLSLELWHVEFGDRI